MTELKGISDTKSKKEASLKEIRDRESSKESKNMAMAELKKVKHNVQFWNLRGSKYNRFS